MLYVSLTYGIISSMEPLSIYTMPVSILVIYTAYVHSVVPISFQQLYVTLRFTYFQKIERIYVFLRCIVSHNILIHDIAMFN